jgi:predicted type IV restriction endonuclease
MQTTKEKAYKKVARLVEQFDEHIDEYKRGKYNEHQTRVDYINPFFDALGWDMDNKQGLAEAYREVIHEDKIKIGGSTKAPDYCFTVYGQRKFFVDAKKPSINIKGDIAPAYQVRRYGWSARLPVAIVTDFEEFSIYDCNKKPNQTDKASVSRIKYITYDNYLDEFDFFWDTFAKENILKGRFDKYVQSDAKKRGTANVDDEFLKSIEEWRTYLATTIALRNKSLIEDEINYAVQKNIDRIIFLRICEDRGIEHYGDLKNAIKKGIFYQNLFELYRFADEKYNSGLFDFNEDTITSSLTVDNKVVKNIISDLYYPVSPYEFSVLPADILGSVYERFLGKTIRLTKAHHAKIEEKPEVRKAGGVYYTPKYIVDYIVENTVGKLIKDKKPKDIEKIKIVDPACGSGSFLIGAYQYLLDRHLQYYTENPPQKKKDNPLTPDGNLTTAEKKRILLNNIYGVDIDAQAVEVTKLNLLLKALEGETNASISKQLTFFNERVLPNLENNIKCGNSLIGTDFYDNQLVLFPGQIKKINAFDWDKAFPEIFRNGGFDAVIGNPPYLGFQEGSKEIKNYYVEEFKSAKGKYDHYILFVEKSMNLLKSKGYFSFIIPNKFIQSNYGKGIKEVILNFQIIEIINFNDIQVFSGATNYPCILIIKKENPKKIFKYSNVGSIDQTFYLSNEIEINQKSLTNEVWVLVDNKEQQVLDRLNNSGRKLDEISEAITQGIRTGNLKVYFNNINSETIKENNLEKDLIKQVFHGKNVKRYRCTVDSNEDLLLFPYKSNNSSPVYINHYENTRKYLEQFKDELRERKDSGKVFKNTPKKWFEFWDQKPKCFDSPKIIFPDISKCNNFYLDEEGTGYLNTCYAIFLKQGYNYRLLLGILNSKTIKFFIKNICPFVRGGYYRYKTNYIKQIPLPSNFPRNISENIITLVDNLLNLNQELQSTKLDTHRRQLQRAIYHAENKIDELVYELYGLTEEEIGIVENLK